MAAVDDRRVVLAEQNRIKDLLTWGEEREHKMVRMEKHRPHAGSGGGGQNHHYSVILSFSREC